MERKHDHDGRDDQHQIEKLGAGRHADLLDVTAEDINRL